jgi:AcrR family transcriptional regulator
VTQAKGRLTEHQARSRPASGHVRQSIVIAARALFAQKGYSAATVDEIIVKAKTTKPMLYCYFGARKGYLRLSWKMFTKQCGRSKARCG